MLVPVFILVAARRGDVNLTLPTLLVACFIHPLAVIAHELGHALVGKALGLEVGAISIGYGRLLWRFEVFAIPVHIHAWPLTGGVFFGANTMVLLRTRVWLATLAGPLTTAGVLVATAVLTDELVPVFGSELVVLWFLANLLLLCAVLLPHTGREGGRPYRSDGLALLQIPRTSAQELKVYRMAALLMRGLSLFNARDYLRAKAVAERLLEREPNNIFARIMISAGNCNLGDYRGALDVLAPVLESLSIRGCIDACGGPQQHGVFPRNVQCGVCIA
jgi:hypothetical protein